MKNNQTLPEYLKQLRKSQRYTQKEVAAHLPVSRQTYSHYETGRIKPSVNVLCRLAKFYGVSVDDILAHMESTQLEQETDETKRTDIGKEKYAFSEEFLSCLNSLNEKNREDTLSVMREIVQAKIMKQKTETIGKREIMK